MHDAQTFQTLLAAADDAISTESVCQLAAALIDVNVDGAESDANVRAVLDFATDAAVASSGLCSILCHHRWLTSCNWLNARLQHLPLREKSDSASDASQTQLWYKLLKMMRRLPSSKSSSCAFWWLYPGSSCQTARCRQPLQPQTRYIASWQKRQ